MCRAPRPGSTRWPHARPAVRLSSPSRILASSTPQSQYSFQTASYRIWLASPKAYSGHGPVHRGDGRRGARKGPAIGRPGVTASGSSRGASGRDRRRPRPQHEPRHVPELVGEVARVLQLLRRRAGSRSRAPSRSPGRSAARRRRPRRSSRAGRPSCPSSWTSSGRTDRGSGRRGRRCGRAPRRSGGCPASSSGRPRRR